MHEHIFAKHPELEQNYPSPEWDEEAMITRARDGLEELAALGVTTLVDLTVMGLGRHIPRIQCVAEGLDINIVVATGYYTKDVLPGYFQTHGPGRRMDVPEPLVDMFLRDIQEGIADTGVKAAIIKVVTEKEGLTPDVERVLSSAAIAQKETGVPISTHTNPEFSTGRTQQEFFRSAGVDLSRVIIGHCGESTDFDYLRKLMDNGSTLGMDRFGFFGRELDEQRVDTVVALCEAGYADRMTLSHDYAFFSINTEPSARARMWPDWKHTRVSTYVLPALRDRGVSEAQIEQMMVRNPARLLTPH